MSMDLTAPALPVLPLTKPTGTNTVGLDETAKRAAIATTAKSYESSFLSIMLGQMFEGVSATTFGGGQGEEAFKSFLTDAMAKSMVKHGGIGLSGRLTQEMLRMQGLAQTPAAQTPTTQTPAATPATSTMPAAAPSQALDIAA